MDGPDAGKVADALFGASDKLVRMLDSALGKARDARGRESIRGASEDQARGAAAAGRQPRVTAPRPPG